MRSDVGIALTVNRHREFPEDVKNDRNVVRGQIPGDVNVLLKETQIKAPRINVADVADVARLNYFHDLAHRR